MYKCDLILLTPLSKQNNCESFCGVLYLHNSNEIDNANAVLVLDKKHGKEWFVGSVKIFFILIPVICRHIKALNSAAVPKNRHSQCII
ncbi:hypothetical protein T09_4577 [Trichinella sp. T9]|nr:hypothetical protein T09_4577 [Trichinella sp. T9]